MLVGSVGSQWIGSPFLRELSGSDLFQVLTVIKQEEVSGEMELSVSAGAVEMLHFTEGRPLEPRDKVVALCKRDNLVVAWMPGKVRTVRDAGAETGSSTLPPQPDLAERLRKLLATRPQFGEAGAWVVVARRSEVVARSTESAIEGVQSLVGLVAEINGTFRAVLDEQPLARVCVAFPEWRAGFTMLGGPWMLLYRIPTRSQSDFNALTDEIRGLLRESGQDLDAEPHRIVSHLGSERQTEYVKFRPKVYEPLQRSIQRSMTMREHTWTSTWFRGAGDTIVSVVPREGEPRQELDGDFEALVQAVRGPFASVIGAEPLDMVLHAAGTTIWCVFDEDGAFVANRFDTREVIYKWLAHELYGSVRGQLAKAV